MNNPEKQQSFNERDIDGTGRLDQSTGGGIDETSPISRDSMENGDPGNDMGLTGRLTDILVGDGDGDLLIQRSNEEDTVMRWLLALDMQVMGACRADERLKPLLKLNVSTGVAEDRLLNHLSQHFEPSEVGLLARCLCIPLVSVRVGKINKEGTLFCPTSTR